MVDLLELMIGLAAFVAAGVVAVVFGRVLPWLTREVDESPFWDEEV